MDGVIRDHKGRIMGGALNPTGKNGHADMSAVKRAVHANMDDAEWRSIVLNQAAIAKGDSRGATSAAEFLAKWCPTPEEMQQIAAGNVSAGSLSTGPDRVDAMVRGLAEHIGVDPAQLPQVLRAFMEAKKDE